MIAKLTQTLQRLKTDWAAQLQPDAIQRACNVSSLPIMEKGE
jgi:hypothetical protein